MSNLFIGMLLVFLDFNLNIGRSSIGLIPDFIGYYYIIKGIVELDHRSNFFVKAKPYANGMMYFSGVLYILNILGLGESFGYIGYIIRLISLSLCLYTTYLCVKGINDMEELNGWNLNGQTLFTYWKVLVVLSIIASTIAYMMGILAIAIIIANMVVSIIYLVKFNETKKLYYQVVDEDGRSL